MNLLTKEQSACLEARILFLENNLLKLKNTLKTNTGDKTAVISDDTDL